MAPGTMRSNSRRSPRWLLRLAQVAAAAVVSSASLVASAGSPFLLVPSAEHVESAPAYRYANMTNEQAFAELDRRGISYVREAEVAGVRAPIRLRGALRGVDIHSALPPERRADSIFEILDARLALALDDFCLILAEHDVEEVVHYTMYRPNVPHLHAEHGAQSPKREAAEPSTSRRVEPRDRGGDARPKKSGEPRRRTTGKHPGGNKRLDDKGALPGKATSGKASAPQKQKPAKNKKPAGAAPPAAPKKASAPAATGKAAHAPKKASSAKPPSRKTPGATAPARKKVAARVGKMAPVQRPPAQPAPEGTRHPAGLAIDVGGLRKRDGTWLSVANDFHGTLGAQTCGGGAAVPPQAKARELRRIVCTALERGVFTYVLTPNFDVPHADHFHMEIKPGVRWFLYH